MAEAGAHGRPATGWSGVVDGIGGDELCARGFRGCPFINAAAEFPDAAHPVHHAGRPPGLASGGQWSRRSRTAGHADPESARTRFAMLRDGAMVAGYLADPEAARATLLAAVEDLLAG